MGSGNIFRGVDLRQLQRLFRAAGDQDAEQRAQLVWGHRDEAELAQALVGLRARGRRRGLRVEGRDTLGSCWLRAFNHLRIGESSANVPAKNQEAKGETKTHGRPESPGAPGASSEGHWPAGPSARPDPTTGGPVLNRAGESDPERYLHRIRH